MEREIDKLRKFARYKIVESYNDNGKFRDKCVVAACQDIYEAKQLVAAFEALREKHNRDSLFSYSYHLIDDYDEYLDDFLT